MIQQTLLEVRGLKKYFDGMVFFLPLQSELKK